MRGRPDKLVDYSGMSLVITIAVRDSITLLAYFLDLGSQTRRILLF